MTFDSVIGFAEPAFLTERADHESLQYFGGWKFQFEGEEIFGRTRVTYGDKAEAARAGKDRGQRVLLDLRRYWSAANTAT